MRVCPKCGFMDPQYWMHHRFVPEVDYARYEDVLNDYPSLRGMRPGEERSDANYYYYRAKKPRSQMFIFRYPKFMGPGWYKKSHHITEHHIQAKSLSPGQEVLSPPTPLSITQKRRSRDIF